MKIKILDRNIMFYVVTIISIIALSIAYIAEYIFKLTPCHLCILQRYPYFVLFIIGIIGINISKNYYRDNFLNLIIIFCCIIIFILAAYHYFVEIGFFYGTSECTLKLSNTNIVEEILANSSRSCQDINWKIFGVSVTIIHSIVGLIETAYFTLAFFYNLKTRN